MRKLIFKHLFVALLLIQSISNASIVKKVTVGYFTKENQQYFDSVIKGHFSNFSNCTQCEIINLTPYDAQEAYSADLMVERIKTIPEQVSFVFFDWNEKVDDKNKLWINELNTLVDTGKIVVAAAGVPIGNQNSCPLSRTLLGQVKNSLVIGELEKSDRLLAQCYYGPEMLSALKPPKELIGQGFAPLMFASKLAQNWQKKKSDDWVGYLKNKKNSTKKLWLELQDMF